jgi:hypothetical protein
VAQRTSEIGIRLALGAERRADREADRQQHAGVAQHHAHDRAALTPLVTKTAGTLLFGLEPTDGATFALAVIVLASAFAASSYLPARRASTLDPLVALRHE